MTRRIRSPNPPELEHLLRVARDAVGSEAAVQRVHAGVLSKVHGGAALPASTGGASFASLGKLLGLLVLTSGGGAAIYLQQSQPETERAGQEAHATAPAPRALRASSVPDSASEATRELPIAPAAPAEHVPVRLPPSAAQTAPKTPRRGVRPVPRSAQAPRLVTQPTARQVASSGGEPCADPDAEVALITRAQRALVSQPRAALALLAEHEQRFGCGLLAQERAILRIDAERALGDHDQARRHAREFAARYPEAQEARALRSWLDESTPSGGDHEHKNQPAPLLTP